MRVMAFKFREEIVGKRFLSVRSPGKLKLNKISEWEWRAGVVRAVTHKDTANKDLTVRIFSFSLLQWHGSVSFYFSYVIRYVLYACDFELCTLHHRKRPKSHIVLGVSPPGTRVQLVNLRVVVSSTVRPQCY